jgi:5-hydroxyisourate hydrolase-like protein (transthyretin family)
MRVHAENRTTRSVAVRSLHTRVLDAAAGCPASSLEVEPLDGDYRLGRREDRAMTVGVAMRRDTPDACQGAEFRLRFRARVTR